MPETKPKAREIIIDNRTQKGVYANGLQISINGELAVMDFGFNTPEGKITIVSRVLVPKKLLPALKDLIIKNELKEQETSQKN